jgi:hypothetical protein
MAKASTVNIIVGVSGDGVTSSTAPTAIANASCPSGGETPVSLSSGNNTVTLPTNAIGALIVPPSTSTVAKIIKGVNGDTGIGIHAINPTFLSFVSTQTTFVINAASAEVILVHWT